MVTLTPALLTGAMTSTEQLTILVAVVLTGLVAGTYFAYACSVMLALGKTEDRTFIEVMQKIDVAIQNPVFFVPFFGAPLVSGVAVWVRAAHGGLSGWTIAALVLNAAGLLSTIVGNIPLNMALAKAGDPRTIADPAALRERFERPW